MLHIYGTVFNNGDMVSDSLKSLSSIRVPKKIYIVDNFSTDGTYEKLRSSNSVYLMREKCSRGKGRQLAMEMARNSSEDDDLFMMFDLDTIYTEEFAKYIEWAASHIGENDVFINFLCHKRANFAVPWRDLNNGEDWERYAHFYFLGYNCLSLEPHLDRGIAINQITENNRERRYSNGIKLYVRLFFNTIDLIRGWGIDSPSKLRQYFSFISQKVHRTKYAIILTVLPFFFIYCIIFTDIYSYGNLINRLLIRFVPINPIPIK